MKKTIYCVFLVGIPLVFSNLFAQNDNESLKALYMQMSEFIAAREREQWTLLHAECEVISDNMTEKESLADIRADQEYSYQIFLGSNLQGINFFVTIKNERGDRNQLPGITVNRGSRNNTLKVTNRNGIAYMTVNSPRFSSGEIKDYFGIVVMRRTLSPGVPNNTTPPQNNQNTGAGELSPIPSTNPSTGSPPAPSSSPASLAACNFAPIKNLTANTTTRTTMEGNREIQSSPFDGKIEIDSNINYVEIYMGNSKRNVTRYSITQKTCDSQGFVLEAMAEATAQKVEIRINLNSNTLSVATYGGTTYFIYNLNRRNR